MMPEGFEPHKDLSIFNPVTGEEHRITKGTRGELTDEQKEKIESYGKGIKGEISVTLDFEKNKDVIDALLGNDVVNHPTHYTQSDVEVIDAIEAITSRYPASIRYHLGNLIKYVCRAPFKNGVEDLQKGLWYSERARKNPIVQVETVKSSMYTVDIDTFILDSALGYDKNTYPFVVSILNTLAGDESIDAYVKYILEDVSHGLKSLIKVLEKSTK